MLKVNLPSGPIIHYRQIGEGPPLLLQHGWGGSSLYWQGTAAHLSDIRTVYSIDLPGYGQSPPMTTDQATPQRLSELIIEFMDVLAIERMDLVGHSFGSNLVSYVAADYPERVPRLVLTCPATYRDHNERRLIKVVHRLMGLTLRLRRPWVGNMPPVYRRFSERFFYRLPKDEVILREGFEDFLRMDRRTATESAISAANEAVNDALQRIQVKTLIVGASNDQIMPRHGPSTVARMIPGSRLVWIEDCGHLPMVERPEVYHWLLRNFLTSDYVSRRIPAATANPVPVLTSQVAPSSVAITTSEQEQEEERQPARTTAQQRERDLAPPSTPPSTPPRQTTRLRQTTQATRQPARITAEHLAQARQSAQTRQSAHLMQQTNNRLSSQDVELPVLEEEERDTPAPTAEPAVHQTTPPLPHQEAETEVQTTSYAATDGQNQVKQSHATQLLSLQQAAEEAAMQAREAAQQAATAAAAAYQAAIAARHAEELVVQHQQQAALAIGERA